MVDPKHPRHYEEVFKRRIVQLREVGKSARSRRSTTSCILHCTGGCGGSRNGGSTKASGNHTPGQNELIELRKRNRQLEVEVDVLK